MDSHAISLLLSQSANKDVIFTPTLAIDELHLMGLHNPAVSKKCQGYIINTDRRKGRGRHWMAVFSNPVEKNVELFDSLALSHPLLNVYLHNCKTTVKKNLFRLQPPGSDSCGYFVLFYLLNRSWGVSFNDILNVFSTYNLQGNESIVRNFVSPHMGSINGRSIMIGS